MQSEMKTIDAHVHFPKTDENKRSKQLKIYPTQ